MPELPDDVQSVDSIFDEMQDLSDDDILAAIDADDSPEVAEPGTTLETDESPDAPEDPPSDEADKASVDLWAGRAYKILGSDGKPLASVDGVSLQDLIDGNAKLQYKASGETKTVDLNKLVDWGTRLPATHRAADELRAERKQLQEKLAELQSGTESAKGNEQLLRRILSGDDATLQQARQEYQRALGGDYQPPDTPADKPDEQTLTLEEQQRYSAGVQLVEEVIKPQAEALAQAYGVDVEDVGYEIAAMIAEEGDSLSWTKVGDIMNNRVISRLEAAGYDRSGEYKPFDHTEWEARVAANRETESERQYGIRPKGEKRVKASTSKEAAKLAAENERLRRELAEARVAESGPDASPDASAASSGVRHAPGDDQYKSEVLDLREANSVDDVMKALDAMEEQYG